MKVFGRVLLGAVTGIAVVIGATSASADGYRAGFKDQPVTVFSWTGAYIGINAGYGWNNDPLLVLADSSSHLADIIFISDTNGTNSYSTPFNAKGWIGGVQTGYNLQFSRLLVAGVETDLQLSRIEGDTARTGVFVAGFPPRHSFRLR